MVLYADGNVVVFVIVVFDDDDGDDDDDDDDIHKAGNAVVSPWVKAMKCIFL